MRYFLSVLLMMSVAVLPARADAPPKPLAVTTPLSPPAWALLQRQLLAANAKACREFYAKYFD